MSCRIFRLSVEEDRLCFNARKGGVFKKNGLFCDISILENSFGTIDLILTPQFSTLLRIGSGQDLDLNTLL